MRGEARGARSTRARPTTRSSQPFIAKYGGQQLLGAPIDKGFNRLAWLFPYLVGAAGVVVVGFDGDDGGRGIAATTPAEPPSPTIPDLDGTPRR